MPRSLALSLQQLAVTANTASVAKTILAVNGGLLGADGCCGAAGTGSAGGARRRADDSIKLLPRRTCMHLE